mmetsp:Transcript_24265/g.35276  ORF Transcript_24265/g.35276 Transcript_24265/m.35276 type:complete len:243 (+) Transcript_24265:159-887(+)
MITNYNYMTAPKKYIKINGILKLNPAYTQWREAQQGGQPAYTANTPQQQQQQEGTIVVKAELVDFLDSTEEVNKKIRIVEDNLAFPYGNEHNRTSPQGNEHNHTSPYGGEHTQTYNHTSPYGGEHTHTSPYGGKNTHISPYGGEHNGTFPGSGEHTSTFPYGNEHQQIILNKKRRQKQKRRGWTTLGTYGGAIVGGIVLAPVFPLGFVLGGAAGGSITHAAHKRHGKKKIRKLERKLAEGRY